MRTTQSPPLLLIMLLLLVAASHSRIELSAFPSSPAPSPTVIPIPKTHSAAPTKEDIDFIRRSCASTQYPLVCLNTLYHYAGAVRQNPRQLDCVAISLSLSRARLEVTYFSNLSRNDEKVADPRAAAALHDCVTVFRAAVDQLRRSLKQMRNLPEDRSSESFRFQMSNIRTWMSAALTNEETCKDGFVRVRGGPLKTDVLDRVQRTKVVTSNALALVNGFADDVSMEFVYFP